VSCYVFVIGALTAWFGPTDADMLVLGNLSFRDGLQRRDNTAEARPAFRQAAAYFDALVERGYRSRGLFQNQGNAHLLAGEPAPAIFAYRRGLRLANNDRTLRDGLTYAREQVAYPVTGSFARPPAEAWPAWIKFPSRLSLLLAAFGCYAALMLCATLWVIRRRAVAVAGLGVSLVLFLAFVGVFVRMASIDWEETHYPLVVIADDGVLFRTGNGPSYPLRSETPLNRGVEARLLAQRSDWLQIELGSGEVGWIPRTYALIDAS
jgi:hypothetical protein